MLFYLFFLINFAFANTDDYQIINIYVDLSEVYAPDGSQGTSTQLNVLVAHYAQLHTSIEHNMHRYTAPSNWNGEVNVYDWTNIQFMPGFNHCNYSEALKCGVQNNHWTLKTAVSVGNKYTVITQKIYDGEGRIISHGTKTAWGKIRWKPQWKLTKIKEQGPFGAGAKEIFEMWPPVMEELPPLVKPSHIYQTHFGAYSVDKRACKVKECKD